MKTLMTIIVCIAACSLFTACSHGNGSDKKMMKASSPHLENEPDQTDVFAIPLDNSEEEEEQEMKQLQNIGTKQAEKKEAQHKKPQL